MMRLRQRSRQLAAFVPQRVVRQMLAGWTPHAGEMARGPAAVLFADISGFTAMAETLALDGPLGAEALNRAMLAVFTPMVDAIHALGGTITHFYGDAMLVYFPDDSGQAAARAQACAARIERIMQSDDAIVYTRRSDASVTQFALTIKVGVGYGLTVAALVGDSRAMEFVLGGPGVVDAIAAERQARAGQVVLSPSLMVAASGAATPDGEEPPIAWERWDSAELTRFCALVKPFMPASLFDYYSAESADTTVGEHRPVTNLFVEFSGVDFTHPAIADTLQATYQWAWNIVRRYAPQNGRVNRILTGDKGNQLHILLGAPIAPDGPEQGLRIALALQRERPSYISHLRVGLCSGHVFACTLGAETRHEYTVMGRRVVLAARLTQQCEPGAVLTDRQTANRAHRDFDFTPLPPVTLKGLPQPLALAQVERERRGTAQLQTRYRRYAHPLVGRDAEQATLMRSLDNALEDEAAHLAVSGPPGVGKSHLVATGVRYWLAVGGVGYVSMCQPHSAETAFDPWQEIWRAVLGVPLDKTPAQQGQHVLTAVRGLAIEHADDAPLWGEFFGLPIEQPDGLRALNARQRRNRFFRLVSDCVNALALRQPLLFILEDVHWADQASLDLLRHLVQSTSGLPVAIIATGRQPDALSDLLQYAPDPVHLTLADLPPAAARAQLRQLLKISYIPLALQEYFNLDPGNKMARPINPFYMVEAVDALLATGALVAGDGAWGVRVDEEKLRLQQLPDSVNGLILSRLDRLAPNERAALQLAAVIGDQFFQQTLEALVADVGRPVLVRALGELISADLLEQVAVDPEPVYTFANALVREVVYENMPFERRRHLHGTVAAFLETRYADNLRPFHPALARHYSRAGEHALAVKYALTAAYDAGKMFANRDALRLCNLAERQLQRLPDGHNSLSALEMVRYRAYVQRNLGSLDHAFDDAQRAAALGMALDEHEQAAKAYNLLAELHFRHAAYREAQANAHIVIEQLQGRVPPRELARAYRWSANAASALGQTQHAIGQLEAAQEICTALRDDDELARVLNVLGYLYYRQSQYAEALAAMQRGLALSHDTLDPVNRAVALTNVASLQLRLADVAAARDTIEEALHLTRDKARNAYARALRRRADILAYAGDLEQAAADCAEALALFAEMDDEEALIETYLLWAHELALPSGDATTAARYVALAEARLAANPNRYEEEHTRLWLAKGQLALQQGERDSAESAFWRAQRLVEQHRLTWWAPGAYCGLARAGGQRALAKAQLRHALHLVEEEGGSADFAPRIWLELARLEREPAQRNALLDRCAASVQQRARHADRVFCLSEMAQLRAALRSNR